MGLGNKWVNVLLILMKDEKEAGFSWWEEEETRRHLLSGRGLLEWRAGRGRGGGGGKNEDPASWFSRVSLVYRLPMLHGAAAAVSFVRDKRGSRKDGRVGLLLLLCATHALLQQLLSIILKTCFLAERERRSPSHLLTAAAL